MLNYIVLFWLCVQVAAYLWSLVTNSRQSTSGRVSDIIFISLVLATIYALLKEMGKC